MKVRITKKLFLFAALLILSTSLVTYALTTLFTQTFPSQTFATPTLVPNPSCSGGTLVLDTTASTNPTYSGGPAALVYGCDTSGADAFTAQGTSSVTVTATETVTGLPSGWTILLVNSPSGCTTSTTGGITSSGSYVDEFQGGSSWVYCLYTTNAASFSSFTVSYSQ